ncbi:MAG: amidohydrolase family protein [Pirellulales bacterium]|nr:amidohydrolase family protein [Pirellulales bacterium]
MNENCFALRARWVLPIDAPPIAQGVVTIEQGRIAGVGRRAIGDAAITDLGDVALLPGLVNAHTHLEFSDCARPLGERGTLFASWIGLVTRYRHEREAADPLAAQRAIALGLRESIAAGTTTLGEITTRAPALDPAMTHPIDVTSFWEVIALDPARFNHSIDAANAHWQAASGYRPGVSPHAPYTVHPELFGRLVDLARDRRAPVAFHLAESPAELELLDSQSGPLFDYLSERGFWRHGAIAPRTRPMDYLRKLATAQRSLVVHGNYLSAAEIEFAAEHAERLSVIYCPRTHDYFGHERHPLVRLLARGATVALGTDSRASTPDLSLWAEMRMVAAKFPDLDPAQIIELGTLAGARALGLDQETGSLMAGKRADLVAIPLVDGSTKEPAAELLASQWPVTRTMFAGRWIDAEAGSGADTD